MKRRSIEALKTGVIAGAAIDVFDPEPPLNDNPLFELDNIILSPHSAALTQECVIRMATGAAEGVVDVLYRQAAAVRRQPRGLQKVTRFADSPGRHPEPPTVIRRDKNP